MPSQYRLTFINQSAVAGTACLYQTAPEGLQSLAWLVRDVTAAGGDGATAAFGWNVQYGYMYLETGSGTGFGEVVAADPQSANQITFNLSGNTFGTATAGTPAGTLTIDESTPVMVGFALSGSPLFGATPAPSTLTFETAATPSYQLAFGNFTAGQVMPASISNPAPVTVTFPPNVFAMTATLSASNVLTVAPSS